MPQSERCPSLDRIMRQCALAYEVPVTDLKSYRRPARLTEPRRVAWYLSYTMTHASYPAIGTFWGRDHSTIWNGVAEAKAAIGVNDDLALKVRTLKTAILEDEEVDPIRGALLAAAGTMSEQCGDGDMADWLHDAALAVSTFLRALPVEGLLVPGTGSFLYTKPLRTALAAAIEHRGKVT